MRILKAVALLAVGVSPIAAAGEPDFVSIFNGQDLDGWVVMGKPEGFAVAEGVLVSEGGKGGGWIRTTKEYGNFILRLEWMLSTNGNSGILIRTGEKGTGGGFEVQLLAPWTPRRDDLHCTGSIYGHVAVDPRPDETPNRWHEMEIGCRYKEIRVAVDGQVVCRGDMDAVESLRSRSLRGYIGMQASHSGAGPWVKFRNLRIRDLDREPAFILTGLRSSDRVIRDLAKSASVRLGAPMVTPLLDLMSEGQSKSVSTAEEVLFAVVADASVPGEEDRGRAVAGVLAEQAATAASDRARAYAARMLGILGGENAGSTQMSQLSAGLRQPAMFDAALSALQRISDEGATHVLLRAVVDVPEERQPRVIRALGGRQTDLVVEPLIRIATGQSAANRAAALDALGMSGDERAAQPLADALSDPDEAVRRAACGGLIALADSQRETEALLASRLYRRVLDHAATPAQRTAAILGLTETDPAGRVKWLLAGLTEDHSRRVVRPLLAAVPDAELLDPLRRRLDTAAGEDLASLLELAAERNATGIEGRLVSVAESGDDASRTAALRLLAERPATAVAYGHVLTKAAATGEGALKQAAMPGCLVIADHARESGDVGVARGVYRLVLENASDTEALSRALAGLGAIGDPAAAEWVAQLLGDSPVREQAGQTYLALANAMAQQGQKDAAIEAYTTLVNSEPLLNAGSTAGERLRELGVERDFAAELGFISKWWIIGPFPNPDQSAYEKALFPEKGINLDQEYEQDGRKLTWIAHETKSAHGVVELLDLFPGARDVACYAYADIESDADREVLLKFGTDDGFALWLNGERLAGNPAGRALTIDQDTVKAKLRKGKNTILLKVLQGGSRWAFCLRVTDLQGKGLAFSQRDQ